MFSQTTEYALRAVVFLASKGEAAQTLEEIAEGTKVPVVSYLSKIMQGLRRKELVRSQRGSGGGFTLAVSPEQLTVFDVIQAVEPIKRIEQCPLGLPDHIHLCPLHRRLDQAMEMVEKALKDSTIAELLVEPERGKGIPIPLCSWPEEK